MNLPLHSSRRLIMPGAFAGKCLLVVAIVFCLADTLFAGVKPDNKSRKASNNTIASPAIIASTANGAIVACLGNASASPHIQQFTASGNSLTANIIATAPAGFEVSLAIGSGYGSSVTLTQSGGTVNSTPVYVRSAATDPTGSISGNVVLTSSGASGQNVAVSGTVNAIPTLTTVPNQTVSASTLTSAINFTGTGSSFNWVNNTPAIGLAASGSGNIASFTALNTGSTPLTATITVTPGSTSTGFAYIANNSSNNVSVINTATNTVVATIPVGKAPSNAFASPDGSRVYTTDMGTNDISVISTATNTVIATIPTNQPNEQFVSPDGSRLYVTNTGLDSLTVINTVTNSVIAEISAGPSSFPDGITGSPDGSRIYIARGAGSVIVISTATNTIVATITIPPSPTGITISPDGSKVYVANQATVSVISTATNTVIATIADSDGPYNVTVSPDGNFVYAANLPSNTVSVINTATNTIVATVPVGSAPAGIAVTADGSLVYVANHGFNTVSVINTATNTVIATISVGTGPYSLGNFITGGAGCTGAPITLTITVNPLAPPTVSYAGPQIYSTGNTITPLAPTSSGVGVFGYSSSPVSIGSGYNFPQGVAVDAVGNIYVADDNNAQVKKIPVGGGPIVTLGSGFSNPNGVAVDAAGNVYVADAGTGVISKILAAGGAVVTIGSGFVLPGDVALDAAGNVYVTDYGNNRVVKIPVGGGPSTTLGSGFHGGQSIFVDAAGNVFVADNLNNAIKEIPVGGGAPISLGSGFNDPQGVAVDNAGNVFVADRGNAAVKMIPAGGGPIITLGSGFIKPNSVAIDAAGTLFIADDGNNTIEKIKPTGGYIINPALPAGLSFNRSTGVISGTPTATSPATTYTVTGYNAGGSISSALSITVNSSALAISYASPQKYTLGTAISPLAPTSTGVAAPGYASETTIASGYTYIAGMAVDAAHNVYVADFDLGIVQKIPAGGGTPVTIGTGFTGPDGLNVDAAGNVYVGDYGNNAIKKIPAGGGSPVIVYTTAAPPLWAVADAAGNLYVTEFGVNQVIEVPAGGGPTTTIGGTVFAQPDELALDGAGNLYVADYTNHAIYKVPLASGVPVLVNNQFTSPSFLTVDASDNLFVGDNVTGTISMIPAASSSASAPINLGLGGFAVAVDGAGNLYTSSNAAVYQLKPVGGYYITPFLPAGLTFKNSTGVISGTPTAVSPATSYTVTAYNIAGMASSSVSIQTVLNNNANLADLKLSNGTLSPRFAVGTTSYTADVGPNAPTITVTPFVLDSGATVTVNGTAVATGTASAPVALTVGPNPIDVVVTAADGVSTNTYTVTVTRAQSNNALLTSLQYVRGFLTPAFSGANGNYTLDLANRTNTFSVTPTASDPGSTITVNGIAVASGTASPSFALTAGANTITTIVTAPDGVTTKTYTITVTRAGSSNALLTSLHYVPGFLTPAFSGANTSYALSVANSVTTFSVTPTTAQAGATITVSGIAVISGTASPAVHLSVGSNVINTIVTAEDGVTTKTYTITVTRATGPLSFVPNQGLSLSDAAYPAGNLQSDGIVVHHGVSPNGDGIDDFLAIDGISNYPDNKLMIVSRSGQLVFEANGYGSVSKFFDGRSNKTGAMQLPGTYFYSLDYKVNGVPKHKTGFIILKY